MITIIIVAIGIIALYYFVKKKPATSYQKEERSADYSRTATAPPKETLPPAVPYVEKVVSGIYDTEYISNLRVGRSWVLPQFIDMNFDSEGRYDKSLFLRRLEYGRGYAYCWKVMLNNYRVLSIIEKKDPDGYAQRARWWTKQLAIDVATAESADEQLLSNIARATSSKELYDALLRYSRSRSGLNNYISIPQAFIKAFAGDGAFHAMMTMVKYLKLYYKDANGNELTRDQCIDDIKAKAEEFGYDGLKMLDYCREKYFESGLFDYRRYKA